MGLCNDHHLYPTLSVIESLQVVCNNAVTASDEGPVHVVGSFL